MRTGVSNGEMTLDKIIEHLSVRVILLKISNRRMYLDLENFNSLISLMREIYDSNVNDMARVNPIKCIDSDKNIWLIEVVVDTYRFYFANDRILYMTFVMESEYETVALYESYHSVYGPLDMNGYCKNKLNNIEINFDKWTLIDDSILYELGWNGYISTYAKKVKECGNLRIYTRIAMDLSKNMWDVVNKVDYYVNDSSDLYSCVNRTSDIELLKECTTKSNSSKKNNKSTGLKKIVLNDSMGIEIDIEKDNINSAYCKLHQSLRVYNNEIAKKSLKFDTISYLEVNGIRINRVEKREKEGLTILNELSEESDYKENIGPIIQVKTRSVIIWGTVDNIIGMYVCNPIWYDNEHKRSVIHDLEDITLVNENGDKRKLLDLLNLINVVCGFREAQPYIEYTEVEFEGHKIVTRDILGYSNFGKIGIEFLDFDIDM